jgi:hypothetical protein
MWRPETIGDVIAERVAALKKGGRRVGRIRIRFGRPVRSPVPEAGDPWWCPVQITGAGSGTLRSIAGVDSLQALILALEFATDILPHEAARVGAQVDWLGEAERIVFARQGLSHAADNAIVALLGRLKAVAAVLDSGDKRSRTARRRAIDALSAIGSDVGHPPARKKRAAKKTR